MLTSSSRYSASDFLYMRRLRTLVVCFFLFFFVSSNIAIEAGKPAGAAFVGLVDSCSEMGEAKEVAGISWALVR